MNMHVAHDLNAADFAEINRDCSRRFAPPHNVIPPDKRQQREGRHSDDVWTFAVFGFCEGVALVAALLMLALVT
jgi:hypothetical protein